ncbi:tetratricopeptide repeat-containing protein [Rhizobium ruizarguesonis]|uniref:tetratricopeptide repeat-containing protein n=1 Tax=Rhizobium ruizarguesonis TaxID=2081791 RepID=UPI00103217E8|nr:tetratricopeptide repeat-containing protein [Rhizobium ruizarguesonis]MBY5883998.1 hypothetical protein [Rhizobium leguminosarum]NKL10865.1 hypothetical protein [Rhizobium leguminosarum bv. viciae]NEJ03116.1 hypothetical protein [Rhizobium ruizarguesonis]NEJ40232.1 hypothetical protein [Rhizobium ruizarguesonis]TAT91708.1 hypothetical protein ELI53_37455 [Rhizobium ruizarguesonis]
MSIREFAANRRAIWSATANVQAADRAFQILEPDQTTDPEMLGLWSAVHKRRSAPPRRLAAVRLADPNTAIYAAERGFLIRQDCYTGINLAYLFDLRASISSDENKIADRVFANRVHRRVVDAAEKALNSLTEQALDSSKEVLKEPLFWLQATLAEALIASTILVAKENWQRPRRCRRQPGWSIPLSGKSKT